MSNLFGTNQQFSLICVRLKKIDIDFMEERRSHGTNDFKAIERTRTAFQHSVQYGTLRKEK